MKKYNKSGFTLIELLVVIAIIGLLAGMFMGTFSAIRTGSKKTTARSEIEQIKIAWEQYLSEYHNFAILGGDGANDVEGHGMNKDALDVLCGYDETHNRLEIPFLDFTVDKSNFKDGEIAYIDPWGEQYKFSLDGNGDNTVNGQGGQAVHVSVAVWSTGPDMTVNTKDDIVSWK